jgi:molecular chaperone GrpE
MTAPEDMGTGPVIRDHRRIDPVTGQPKRGKHAATESAGTGGAGRPGGPDQPDVAGSSRHGAADEARPAEVSETSEAGETVTAEAESLRTALAERTADLQRLQAEYANYRKRVDRDRAVMREQAVASALTELLPVLDAIGQAREHGELSGGFKSVADSLQAALGKLGLASYGQRGDPFDPKIHEALTHTYSQDVAEVTCVEILQPGYKVGERILRPARVAVAEPATGPDGGANAAGWSAGEEETD